METYRTPKGIMQQMQDTIDNYLQHVYKQHPNCVTYFTTSQLILWPSQFSSLFLFSALHCFLVHLVTDFWFGIGNFWIQML